MIWAIIKKSRFPIEPGKKNSKTIKQKVRLFGDSVLTPEAWVKWRIELEEIISDFPLETGKHKAPMVLALLTGRARDKFQHPLLTMDTQNAAKPEEQRKT